MTLIQLPGFLSIRSRYKYIHRELPNLSERPVEPTEIVVERSSSSTTTTARQRVSATTSQVA